MYEAWLDLNITVRWINTVSCVILFIYFAYKSVYAVIVRRELLRIIYTVTLLVEFLGFYMSVAAISVNVKPTGTPIVLLLANFGVLRMMFAVRKVSSSLDELNVKL